jgi:putative chitinase
MRLRELDNTITAPVKVQEFSELERAIMEGGHCLEDEELEEGWKDWVAGGAMALSALGAQAGDIVSQEVKAGDTVYSIARDNGVSPSVLYKLNGFNNNTKLQPGQYVKVPDVYKDEKPATKQTTKPEIKKPSALRTAVNQEPAKATATTAPTIQTITNSPLEKIVLAAAIKNGITGTELAAFMAQVAHESHDFQSMVEYGGSLDFRKYDIRYNPKKAKELGNKYAGDGNRYKGRGFIQITGRYNYRIASKAIGVDLVKNPALAEDPTIAAKIAVWFWKHRVQPKVDNWNDVRDVTKPINPGLNGLEDREENFKDYLAAMVSPTDKTSAKV